MNVPPSSVGPVISGAISLASDLIVVTIPLPEIKDCSFVSNCVPELPQPDKSSINEANSAIRLIASPARDVWPVRYM